MKRLIMLFCAAMLGGCVSAGKYKDLQAQYEGEMQKARDLGQKLDYVSSHAEDLSKSKSQLESEKADLVASKAALEAQTTDLAAQKAKLEADMGQLRGEKNTLEAEKQALLAASQEKQKQYDGILGQLQKEVSDGQLKITQYQNMLTVDVADKILFDSGKAEIKGPGKAILKKVGEALSKGDKSIRVVGHTDNVKVTANAAYASNWELSAARATTVVRFLQEQAGIEPKRLIAAGRGEYAPVAPNDTPENRQKNRRIEITLLDKSLVEAVELAK